MVEEIIENSEIQDKEEYIYFDTNKKAYAYEIPEPLCRVLPEEWQEFCLLTLGKEYDVTSEGIIDLRNTEEYKEEQTKKREQEFKNKFFKVGNYGYYRRQPKGYQSAVESMNVLFNIANVTKGLQAGLIIFYQEPDFTDAEQCTEEWLIEHQIIMPVMTLEEFLQLYVVFMTAWNTEEHEKVEGENDNTTNTAE